MTTLAGTGVAARGPDNVLATSSALNAPASISYDRNGNAYIADSNNNRIRRIDTSGVVTALAGDGTPGSRGDGGPATQAELNFPAFVLAAPDGSVFISDSQNNRVRRVDVHGMITTVAGTGNAGSAGDGGLATLAQLNFPAGLALDSHGNLYIADLGNNRVRRLAPDGTLNAFAGTGTIGSDGDEGPASQALLTGPYGLALGPDGTLYIAGFGEQTIRAVTPDGIIHRIAGTGIRGFTGDGEYAIQADLNEPAGLVIDPQGNLYVMDSGNNRIRRISTLGFIQTVVGTGDESFNGDGLAGPATALAAGTGIAIGPNDGLSFTDDANNRVRFLSSRIPAPLPGDVNGDGGITVADATLVLRFAIGLDIPTPSQIMLGDVAPSPGTDCRPYGDGKLDIADAVRILRRAIRLDPDPWP